MDPVKILKRAWHIVWNYRMLWVFGFILALTVGSSGGSGNSGSRFSSTGSDEPRMEQQYDGEMPDNVGEAFREMFEEGLPALERELNLPAGELTTMVWVFVAFIVVMVLFGLAMTAVRYATEVSTIRMVDEFEASGVKKTFKEGWRLGWNRRAWKLFLIDLVVNIPVYILLIFFAVMGFVVYKMVTAPGAGDPNWAGFAGIIGIVLVVVFVVVITMVFLNLLRHFFSRKAALEELGVRDSLRAGYQLFRANWKDVGIMWLVMIGVGIAWGIASIILAIVALPAVAVTVIVGAIVAAIPGLLLVGFFSLFLSRFLPWIAGGLFVLPLFFIVGFSPWVFLSGLWLVYTSTVWTLVYREVMALPELAVDGDEPDTDIVEVDA